MTQTAAASCVDSATVGTISWTNPGNARISNNVYATSSGDNNAISHYLQCTDFGFTIPTNATILGIEVDWERFAGTATTGNQDNAVRIVVGGTIDTTVNRAAAGAWSTTQAFYPYGGASDLWGLSWTPADINDSGFGAALSVKFISGGGNATASVDSARITVTYTQ